MAKNEGQSCSSGSFYGNYQNVQSNTGWRKKHLLLLNHFVVADPFGQYWHYLHFLTKPDFRYIHQWCKSRQSLPV